MALVCTSQPAWSGEKKHQYDVPSNELAVSNPRMPADAEVHETGMSASEMRDQALDCKRAPHCDLPCAHGIMVVTRLGTQTNT